ncbi:DDE_3 domain-containing protein [Trichonephila clavipes]|nr:DDE_3 domain-containing protein [Trichonephila clavipes]
MSQRRRLPNSLRWRAVGWMEMGLSQADAAKRSMCLVVLFSNFGINTNPKILFSRPTTSYNTCRRPFSSSFSTKEKCRIAEKHQEEESPLLRDLARYTDLHVFHGGTVTGLRYRDEILDPYVRPYAASIGNDFILMDDNARPHRARIVEEYLEDHGLERMEWPARSPDLNPIEHLLGLS